MAKFGRWKLRDAIIEAMRNGDVGQVIDLIQNNYRRRKRGKYAIKEKAINHKAK